MIASLRGTVIDKGLDYVVVECAGVGYHCTATASTLAQLTRGEEACVLTAMVVREDSQTLYAFSAPAERDMFYSLQKVSGVGARLALGVMSVLSPVEISQAVSGGDAKTLQRAPGVGKRLAERMAVDLKGKIPEFEGGHVATPGAEQTALPNSAVLPHVVEALVGLGFTESKSKTTVDALAQDWPADRPLDSSDLLRQALARISS